MSDEIGGLANPHLGGLGAIGQVLLVFALAGAILTGWPATDVMGQDTEPTGTVHTGTPATGAAAICAGVVDEALATPGSPDDHDHAGEMGSDGAPMVLAPFDLLFLDVMVARDAGTATIGRLIAARATDPRVRDLGQSLAEGGDANVAALDAWRDTWYPSAPEVNDLQLVQLVDEAEAGAGAPADGGMGGGDPAVPEDDLLTLCGATDGFDAVALQVVAARIETDVALAGIAFGRAEHVELLGFARSRGESGLEELTRIADLALGVTAATPPA